jgi:hypothetical protein
VLIKEVALTSGAIRSIISTVVRVMRKVNWCAVVKACQVRGGVALVDQHPRKMITTALLVVPRRRMIIGVSNNVLLGSGQILDRVMAFRSEWIAKNTMMTLTKDVESNAG